MKDALWLLAGVFLSACAYSDLRSGMISVKSCLLMAGTGAALRVLGMQGAASVRMCASDLVPGMFVMGIAVISGEQIGKGDAWIVLVLGVLVGAKCCMGLFMTALVLSLPFAVMWRLLNDRKRASFVIACRTGKDGERPVPFAPELLLAYLLWTVRG